MLPKTMKERLINYHKRLNGSTIEYELDNYDSRVTEIIQNQKKMEHLSEEALKSRVDIFKDNILFEEDPTKYMVEAYALVSEAIIRVLNLQPFREQIIGAIGMAYGKLIEMKTGEGKTLVAVYPAFLYGLSGKGVHVLTFNDYLAKRDALWMKPVFEFLGTTVGFIHEGMSPSDRKKAYRCDITYVTAKESGFDFLRDGLCYDSSDTVQRNLNFAIIDEADSILIDEARIPLVIAETSDSEVENVQKVDAIILKLLEKQDFDFDEYARNVFLTEHGIDYLERMLCCENLYDKKNSELLSCINYALHAHYLLNSDVDYIVRKGTVEQVDEFTGRIADKRRWPNGLQAAIEAKEHVAIQKKGRILNSISLQYFIGLYPKKCGMTATAKAAEEEFRDFFNLHIMVIGPHKTCIRKDEEDRIFCTKKEKMNALLHDILHIHATNRPILVGTRSVAESIELSEALKQHGLDCYVLNAKNDAFEATIIADAGKLGAVTISTNMAGRGIDIRLGGEDEKEKKSVVSLGGLYVIGTNKHESLRIDNQLRGRAARQGDPGSTRFFISLEDDLFMRYRLSELIPPKVLSTLSSGEIMNPFMRKEINRVQRIVEGQNYEIKRTLSRYTFILEQQRKIMFEQRRGILDNKSIHRFYEKKSPKHYQLLYSGLSMKELQNVCKNISLYKIDQHWCHYLQEMSDIRDGIHLRRFGGQEPLFEFQKLAITIFNTMNEAIAIESVESFNSIQIINGCIDSKDIFKTPSSTWTYLINDKTFDDMLGLQFLGNIGLSIGVIVAWPFMVLIGLYKKIFKPYIG